MFKRTFKIVFRPVKNNFVILPENYFKVVSTYVSVVLLPSYAVPAKKRKWNLTFRKKSRRKKMAQSAVVQCCVGVSLCER